MEVVLSKTFRQFFDYYQEIWKICNFDGMKALISKDYQAREITKNVCDDFGYEESLKGWREGFSFVQHNHGQWDLFEIGVIPLGKDEYMGILAASIVIGGKSLQNANLFFETFTYQDEEWKRVRSYIETGIPAEQLKEYRLNR